MLPIVDRMTIDAARDPELVDDREVDEGIERRLAVDQRVLDREQAERDARADLLAHRQRDVHAIECCMGAGGSEACRDQSCAVDAGPARTRPPRASAWLGLSGP